MTNFKLRRVDLLFIVGIAIVLSEAFRLRGPADPTVIFAGLALMGLPVVVRGDEQLKKNGKNGNGKTSQPRNGESK